MDKPAIGMIGIGLMGHGIARNVAKHYPLVILDHPGNQPLDELQAAGARIAHSAKDVAAAADVVILCVTGTPQVEAVLLGAGGVLEGLKPGAVVIDCSTAIPTSTERVSQAVAAKGGRFLDAPMTRTPKEAADDVLRLTDLSTPDDRHVALYRRAGDPQDQTLKEFSNAARTWA